jgi:hypothetical protein
MPSTKPFALTVLSPIIGGTTGGVSHAVAIRRILGDLETGAQSPLAGILTLHFARWVVIDDVQSQGCPAREEHLRSKYLLFTADFDGALASFLDSLLDQAQDRVQSLWEHCVGFPGVEDRAAFCRYFERCQLRFTLPFAGYPKSTLPAVLKALSVQRKMLAFIQSTQGKAPADLQRAFGEFMEQVDRAPVPAGGWT